MLREALARHSALAGLAAILVAVVAAYAGILDDWFTSDDFYFLGAVREHAASTYFLAAIDPERVQFIPQGLFRPLSLLNYLWLDRVFGLHAWGYHAVSIIIHAVNVVLLWLVAYKLTRRLAVAHLAAIIFGLHPTYSPAVAWISNSMSLFGVAAGLLAFLLSLKYQDGGPRARWYFAGCLIAAAIAGFYHPEALVFLAVICIAYVLVPVRTLSSSLRVRTWLPLAGYVALGVGFVVLHLILRSQEAQQQSLYGWGSFVFKNVVRNMAMAGNPLGTDSSLVTAHVGNRDWAANFGNWRTLTPIIGVSLLSLYLATREWRRPSVGVLVVLWFYLSVVPISTSAALGTPARKLYIAGPGFGLAVAIAVVSLWDRLDAWFVTVRRSREREAFSSPDEPAAWHSPGDHRSPTLVPAALLALVMVVFSVRIAHMTSPDSMSLETHNYGISSKTEKALIDQIRATYPDLPKGSHLELVGLPLWLETPWGIHTRFRLAVELYYDDVTVVGAWNIQDLLAEPPPPPGTPTYRVVFHCVVKSRSLTIVSAAC